MSLLPQRKKSAEEIAKIRESFGLPGASQGEENAALPVVETPAPQQIEVAEQAGKIPRAVSPPREPKPVKSLRKSEQGVAPIRRVASTISKIPVHRRSDHELNEIRRREALSKLAPKPNPQSLVAHLALVIPAYLLVITSAIGCFFYDLEMWITASCLAFALVIGGFIFFKKPLSRYHAAFIAVISLFLIIFGTFHYFPQLLNGT